MTSAEGVSAQVKAEPGADGACLRLDYNFERGAGFCVLRHKLELPLPANYRISFDVRGDGPTQNFELKLLDRSGENVWWVNRREFEWPAAWQRIRSKKRQFTFAWGPSGGAALDRLGALEFAIASVSGGKGTVWLDNVTLEATPEPTTSAPLRMIGSSHARGDGAFTVELPANGMMAWECAPGDPAPAMTLDFGAVRELGGLAIYWAPRNAVRDYDVLLSSEEQKWEAFATVRGSDGGADYVSLPDAEARLVRVVPAAAGPGRPESRNAGLSSQPRPAGLSSEPRPLGRERPADSEATSPPPLNPDEVMAIRGIRPLPPDAGASLNALFEIIARESAPGMYPRYFLGKHVPWTVVGAAGDDAEALLDIDGAIEVQKRGFRIEPMLLNDGLLTTNETVEKTRWLADGYLPIPSVSWKAADVTLEISALAAGAAGQSRLLVRYRLKSLDAEETHRVSLCLLVRPFQVLPPWQSLNITGGVAKISSLAWHNGEMIVSSGRATAPAASGPRPRAAVSGSGRAPAPAAAADRSITPWRPPNEVGVTTFDGGEIVEHLAGGVLPNAQSVEDPRGLASGAMRFDAVIPPGVVADLVIEVPLSDAGMSPLPVRERDFDGLSIATTNAWRKELNRAPLTLPASAADLLNTWRSQIAYILVNADGPAIQPGSRTYERSWIRDGALTCTALLQTGHADLVREYLDWYAPHQFDSGKVPCVVDHRGPDPVDEHDSTGQLLYILRKYHSHTRDRALLERHWPRVVKAMDYLQQLRAERMTPEFQSGPPEKRALYGLLPESISHEGYSAKPMHSYWDDFFALRGMKDASQIADVLGHADQARDWARLADEFRETLYDSMRLVLSTKNIDYIPGCADLGDFDATSTTVGIDPAGELGRIPEPALHNTFTKYLQFFRDRRDGQLEWRDYTPYELRQIGSFIHMEQPDASHELIDWFLRDRTPPEWNQWAEVVYRDKEAPRFIGDLPHTWVGAGFVCAVRTMFVYERESDEAFVLAAGVKPEWLDDPRGVAIADWPTEYGTISYVLTHRDGRTLLELAGDYELPPGGLVIRSPRGAITRVLVDGQEQQMERGANTVTLKSRAKRVEMF